MFSKPSSVGVFPHTNDPPSSQKDLGTTTDLYPDDLTCDDRTGSVNTGLGFLPIDVDLSSLEKTSEKTDTTPDEHCDNTGLKFLPTGMDLSSMEKTSEKTDTTPDETCDNR